MPSVTLRCSRSGGGGVPPGRAASTYVAWCGCAAGLGSLLVGSGHLKGLSRVPRERADGRLWWVPGWTSRIGPWREPALLVHADREGTSLRREGLVRVSAGGTRRTSDAMS